MTVATPVPDEKQLRALLDGTLPESEQAQMLAMVEAHPQWQQALNRLAAGARTWEAAAKHLHEPPLVADAALRSAIAAVPPPTIASDQPLREKTAADLDFLRPSDDPRYLGRFGPYLVEEVIGRGGFGIVLKVFDPKLQRIVAVKVLAPHLATNATACRRFNREALAAAAVVHDHVITIHAVEERDPLPHLVMQYVAGQSLQEKLDRSGPLGIKEVLRIGMQTAAGLAAAHKQGLVHRDIKPANILLENGVERVKITDFGLARAADDASMTQSGTVAGTPQYMSPEQARGETVDARSDLFSLGSVLYAMCVGHPPFRATTTMGVLKRVCEEPPRPIREINPEVPDWLASIIDKLMAKRPEERFASGQEVADLLGQCLSHVQQPASAALPAVAKSLLAPRHFEPTPTVARDSQSAEQSERDKALLDHGVDWNRLRWVVKTPALALVIYGVINLLRFVVVATLILVSTRLGNWEKTLLAFSGLICLLASGLIVLGGERMWRLRAMNLAMIAAVAAILTIALGPHGLIGIAVGIWAIVTLLRPEVRRAFELRSRASELGPSNSFAAGTPVAVASPPGTNSHHADEEAILERARRAVREPAIGLVITGVLNWIVLAIFFVFMSRLFFEAMSRNDDYRWIIPVMVVLGLGSGLLVVGGLKMLRLESRPLVAAAGIAAMLIGPGYFIGFPIGLWALVVLQWREVKEAFAIVRRRHWPGLAGTPAEPLHKPAALPTNVPMPPPAHSSSLAPVLLVLLLLFAIPLTLAATVLLGYLYCGVGIPLSRSNINVSPRSQPIGQVNIDCPDSRFQVRICRTGGDDELVSSPAHVVKHNESARVLPGEYTAAVLWEGIEVRSDHFTVPADASPVTYRVKHGGTLRFIAEPRDRNLSFALNHITGQTIWDWPSRQTFVVPEGLVHVGLSRPDGNGGFPVLTSNYFDIVAGEETVLRVRERDVELVSSAEEDSIVALERENLKAVEARHAAGQDPLQVVIDARLKLNQARVDWAVKRGRFAEALSIRREMVALAGEKVKTVETLYKLERVPQASVNEVKVALFKEQERLKEAEAKVKQLQSETGWEPADASPPAGAVALPRDGTTINDLLLPSMLTFSSSRASAPQGAYGHVSGAVLYLGKSPVLCFGLNQRPGEKSRFTYLILLKTHPDFSTALGGGLEVDSSADKADVKIKLPLAEEPLEIEYHFRADETTHKLLSESLRIGPHECKGDAPRIFLADVTKEGYTLTPIKTTLPTPAPDLGDKDDSSWAVTLLSAVGQLQAASPEIAEFLSSGQQER